MHMLLSIISLLQFSLDSFVLADQHQAPLGSDSSNEIQPHRVAIIGAGAAGSSAAYHLAQYANASNRDTPVEITIFDVNSRVGGRTTTINALDDPRYPTEVGGSIFVKINHILYNATRDFSLDTKDRPSYSTGSAYDLGIWDGSEFVFQVANDDDDASSNSRWKGWWDIAKLLWKYGLSPIKTQRVTKSAIGQFLRLYDDYFPFQSLNDIITETGLTDYTGSSGTETLTAAGVSEKFSRDIIQASTRVNYAQNLGSIHGLETLVCMAIEGAMAVEGGNWQIFDEAVKRSKATLHLETAVQTVTRDENNHFHISTNTSSSSPSSAKPYDTVILAAPYQFANVTFNPPLTVQPETIDYVSLHVTLFTSPHRPSPSFFNLKSQDQVPDSILTTLPPGLNRSTSRGEGATGPTTFWSLSTLRVLEPELDPYPHPHPHPLNQESSSQPLIPHSLGRQYLYKIFSPTPISSSFLESLFALDTSSPSSPSPSSFEPITSLPTKDISWSHTRHWHSYPYLSPRRTFDPFILDRGVYYTSSMEAFISTMETAALAGKNVAKLIWDGVEGDRT